MEGEQVLSEVIESITHYLKEPEVTLLGLTMPIDGESQSVEEHIERSARECYKSHEKMEPSQNVRFLRGIILRGHESVLEHASATFRVLGGSRAYTHEQVRHRLLSFSQQSQRFVNEKDFRAILPPKIANHPQAFSIYKELIEHARQAYARLKELKIKNEDARFVLPNAVESGIVISGNFREWRHVFKLRCSKNAQWEIRRICGMMLKEIKKHAPTVFGDLILNEEDWTVTHISETIDCENAQKKIFETLQMLESKGEKGNKILKLLGDDEVYRALFHVKLCLSRRCKEAFYACGDLK